MIQSKIYMGKWVSTTSPFCGYSNLFKPFMYVFLSETTLQKYTLILYYHHTKGTKHHTKHVTNPYINWELYND